MKRLFSLLAMVVCSQLAFGQIQLGQDIDGEAAGDWSGFSVSLSSDGSRVAIGAHWNDGNGTDAGHVRIYQFANGSWTQLGADIDGEAAGDRSGYSVSLSADGSRVAIGAIYNDGNGSNAGHVRIYQYANGSWTQLGADIDGESADDLSGSSVSMSADGSRVAIGAIYNDGNGSNAGHVHIYQYANGSWTQLGADIDGEAAGDYSGWSVSLSADGNRVAIGARGNDGNGTAAGHVRIYQYTNGSWIQLGADIDGEAEIDLSGESVSLSADGSRVAIGARLNDGNGTSSGNARIYQYANGIWTRLGADIDGEAASDQSGVSVSLSADGSKVAIGAPGNDGNGADAGHVRIYQYANGSWTQLGADIDGEAASDFSGWSVSLSADGSKVAIGAYQNDGNGTDAGHVRVFGINCSTVYSTDQITACGSYTWIDGETYTSSNNTATDTLTTVNGCDSIVSLDLTIYPITGDHYALLGADIDGEAAGDNSGYSVSFSADGSRVAIGAHWNDGNGTDAGHVRIYQYANGSWTQLGADIDGEAAGDESGYSVSLSADGSRVAIGAYGNDGNGSNAGHVRIYQYANGSWTQLGADIDGEAAGDWSGSGSSVSLSADGSRVAIGAQLNDGNGGAAGHVRIYQYANGSWTQLGADIDGEAAGDNSGYSVSLSADGNRVAIGAPHNSNGNGTGAGHVRIYQYANGSWTQLGADIDGEAAGDNSGWSVSLSADGTRVAIGAWRNDGNGTDAGHVRIYQYGNGSWTQLGADIDGEAADDRSGNSVSLSADGSIVAIGAPRNDGNGSLAGHVRIYQYVNGSWAQFGADIDGEAASNLSGYSVSLSADGSKVAIGAPSNDENGSAAGHTRVYSLALTDQIIACGSYTWIDGVTYTSSNNTATYTLTTVNGCDSIVSLDLTISSAVTSTDQITACGSYNWIDGVTYTSSNNTATYTLTTVNGCDSIVSLDLTIYPITGDHYALLGADIDGEAAGDNSGYSVSFSADGSRVAIGAHWNDGNGTDAGHVRIYQYANGSWTQLGADIDGEAAGDESGYSVSLSADGSRVAIGAYGNDGNGSNAGHVRIYQYANGSWTQLGADIDGEAAGDWSGSGSSVSLSADGSRVAIGAQLNDGNGGAAGHVRIYQYANGSWTQLGADIDGEAAGDNSGYSVSLSADGNRVAIGAPHNSNGNGTGAGHVRIYQYANGSWTQLGADIDGEAAGDNSGWSVSLSADGTRVAIGAWRNDGNGTDAGHVRIYQYGNGSWTQLGADIDGEAADDRSGNSVSLSADGSIVAIGAPRNDGNGSLAGHVRIYQYVNGSWAQFGADIDGEAASNLSGYSVSLSADGSKVAIGAPSNDENGSAAGHTRVHSLALTDQIIACGSYTWIDGVTYTSSNNTATYTLTTVNGCDSIVSLDLTISSAVTSTDQITACGSYTWIDGVTYTSSNNTATDTLTTVNGCDSIVSLDLTISSAVTSTDQITACGSYTWIDGVTYTSSNNTATYTLTTVNGCDSIVSLDLTISSAVTSTDQITACGSYNWIDGVTYTSSNNTATYTLTTVNGCDSIVSLDLTIYPITGDHYALLGADIDGEAAGDNSGYSVSFSADGSRVAIGAHWNDGNGTDAGHVRIYQYANGSWTQLGADIDGEAAGDESGYSVSLSADGSRVAIGAYGNDGNGSNAGHVRIYQYANGSWTQLGADIDGEAAGDWSGSGSSVSLSADGSRVAIGAQLNDGNGGAAGHVRIYQYANGSWTQLGADIDGEAAGDNSGYSVSLSADGNRVAIGAPHNSNGNGTGAGHVRIYQYANGSWTQLGADIDGEAAGDNSGWSVSLSADGTRVAIGAWRNDGNGTDAGHVRIYQYGNGSWTQLGADIDGEAADDRSGNSVSLSADGSIVAIGAPRNDGNGSLAGHVRIYQYVNGSWAQFGADIDGEAASNLSGYSVSLSADGSKVAIGAPSNDENGSAAGHTRVHSLALTDQIIACGSYTWIDGVTYTSSNNTATYTLTTVNGCDSIVSLDLTIDLPSIVLSTSSFNGYNISCYGSSDGTASVTGSGGVSPYTYAWSNGATGSSATGLSAGTYTVTVTDANGCSVLDTVTLTQPSALTSTAVATSSFNGYNISCYGSSDGTASVTGSGGVSPYTYAWSNGATSSSATGLSAGTYTVTVTDANGCSVLDTVALTQPSALTSSAVATSSFNGYNISCYGSSDGTASVTGSGGVSPYTYAWSNGATGSSATGLSAGTYTVTVTDANGCAVLDTVALTQPSALTSTAVATSSFNGYNISCYGSSDGTASVTGSGGVSPYTYAWSNGATGSSATGLSAGTYTVTVTDANGCSVLDTVALTQPSALTSSASATSSFNGYNISCNGGSDGTASVTGSGGVSPYTYSWSNGATGSSATGLSAGSYTVSVTDANGCSVLDTVTLTQPSALTSTAVATSSFNGYNISCYGSSDGTASVTGSGGVSPYTYAWSNGATSSSATGLSAGTYTVTVTDANGCSVLDTVALTQPSALTSSAVATSSFNGYNISCYGSLDGTASVTGSGGVSPYTYAWSNGATGSSATGLSAGTYTVTVTDANNCSSTVTVTLTQPSALTSTAVATSSFNGYNISCYGSSDGTASVTGSGGVSPYTYAWSNGATGSSATGLSAGTYTVTVTDANNCSSTATVTLTQPSALTSSAVATSSFNGYNISCNGGSNGSAIIIAAGGVSPYTYAWSNGATGSSATGLSAGTYTVTVTDANNCSSTVTVTLTQPSALTSSAVATSSFNGYNISCYGSSDGTASVTGSGGVSPYTYAWSNGATGSSATGLSAGTYTVTVTDANNCSSTVTVTLTQPSALTSSAVATSSFNGYNISCYGSSDGTASVTGSGGVSPYTYAWSNGATGSSATGLSAGTYTVTVTDANGCSSSANVSISGPAILSAASANSQTSCFGTSDGEVYLAVSGGAPNYSILWNNGQSGTTLTGLSAGWYTYTITDANGCSYTDSTQVLQPEPLEVLVDTIPATCIRSFNGQVNVTAYGGNGNYRYFLNDNEFNGFQLGLGTTDIYIHVVDQVGCDTVVHWEMPPLYDPCVFIPNWFSPNGNGEQDVWRIRGFEYEELRVRVYNVYGQQIYTSSSRNYNPWDGTYNGQEMPAGDYYYVIEAYGTGDNYSGYVTILR